MRISACQEACMPRSPRSALCLLAFAMVCVLQAIRFISGGSEDVSPLGIRTYELMRFYLSIISSCIKATCKAQKCA